MRVLAILMFSSALAAADLTGIWVGQIPGRNGEPVDIAFQIIQKGDTLSGKLYGDYKSTPISEGKVTGEQVSFIVVAPEQSGNQINTTRLRFTGQLKEGTLELTRERESSTNAGNSGGVMFRGNAKQVFNLKKLL